MIKLPMFSFRAASVAAVSMSAFALASAQAAMTLTGDSRFLSAAFNLTFPDGGGTGGGPFTVTPAFGVDQFGSSPGPGISIGGNTVYTGNNFQESSFRPNLIVARGNFGALCETLPGHSGWARVLNRVDYRFTMNLGEPWLLEGTSTENGSFQLIDPLGTVLIANGGALYGVAIAGEYRLLAGDNGAGNSSAASSGGTSTFAGTYDVKFFVPTPGTAAVAAFGLLAAGARRRRA